MKSSLRFSSLIFFFFVLFIAAIAGDTNAADDCVYTLFVRTGSILKAGTDSKIGVTLGDEAGKSVRIPNLEDWGLMEKSHDYFERANLDIFSARGPCIPTPLCRINVTSDGTGPHHGWYLDYVEVTTTGPHIACSQTYFKVEQWLATDAPPYKLSASLDGCGVQGGDGNYKVHSKKGPLLVGSQDWEGYAVSQ